MDYTFPLNAYQNYSSYNPSFPEVTRLIAEIRGVEQKMAPPTTESVTNGAHKSVIQHILSNGMTVGEFCLWYVSKGKAKYGK